MSESRYHYTHPFIIGAAAAGAVGFALRYWWRHKEKRDHEAFVDAPVWARGKSSGPGPRAIVGKSILINRSRAELYDGWQVERFPEFMENILAVEALDEGVSRWTIKGPAGQEVVLINRVSRDEPGSRITWQSEPTSQIENSGEVHFVDAPANRGTYVNLVLAYRPPAGKMGQAAAKLLHREPKIQARRDLVRFKQLMETGEVTSNASPSGRKSESSTQPHI